MSVLDGKQVLTVAGSSYTLQTPPHAAAPWAQNQAFNAVVANAVNVSPVTTVSASTTLPAQQDFAIVVFKGTATGQTITLPTASAAAGMAFSIVNLGTGAGGVAVTSAGGNIKANALSDGLTRTLGAYTGTTTNMSSIKLLSDGTNWFVVAQVGTLT